MNPVASFVADDLRLGRAFIAIGVFGLAIALLIGTVGVVVVIRLSGSMERSLAAATSALESVDGTVELAATTIGTMSGSLDTVVAVTDRAEEALHDAAGIVDESGTVVTTDVPDGLDAVLAALPAIERVAAVVDGTLRALSFVGVGYDPETPFDEAVADLETALGDLPGRLRAQEQPLADLAEVFRGFGTSSVLIARDLEMVQSQVDDALLLLDEFASTTGEAAVLIANIQDDLAMLRVLLLGAVVLLAAVLAALQVVPLALGYRLTRPQTADAP